MPTFGEIIRNRRKELDITQEELAAMLGYTSSTTISRIESGSRDVPQKQIVKIARALRLDPATLITMQMPEETDEDRLIQEYIRDTNIRRLVLCAGGIMPKEERDKFIEAFLKTLEIMNRRQ